jgi:antitoxin HicB
MVRKRRASVSEETFDEFLAEQGMLESTEDHAVKELIAEQLAAAMAEQGLTKIEMAARMKTSRRQLDRLFDPAIPSSFAILSHGPPSVHEAQLGLPEQPSFLFARKGGPPAGLFNALY